MAPTAPKTRPSNRSSSSTTKPSTNTRPSRPISTFHNSKADKRLIKHSTFISRIEKSSAKPTPKRRRPSKKLVTTMDSLADALPDVQELVEKKESGKVIAGGKSLSHGKGFLKRRDKVEKGERERFAKNLGVIMAAGAGAPVAGEGEVGGEIVKVGAPVSATAGRFAAIRSWVSENVEKHEGFAKKG